MSRQEIIKSNIELVERQIHEALTSCGRPTTSPPRLVLVSKLKPPSDIQAAFDSGYRNFGENYIQELCEKAEKLPTEIQWRFIGTLQSNKCQALASIPNLKAVETLSSTKQADLLSKHLPANRTSSLDVYLQVNTSGESVKGGLPSVNGPTESLDAQSPLVQLATHVRKYSNLRLNGLMTIGSLDNSKLSSTPSATENPDFFKLVWTRDALIRYFKENDQEIESLELSMGMSSDFAVAIKCGSDNVRVGSSIFGERMSKDQAKQAREAQKTS